MGTSQGTKLMSLNKISVMAVVFLTLASAGYASGAVVTYNESVNGDLPVFGPPLTNMALDVGTNTVTGNSGDSGATFDFDSFAFTVPANTQVVSANVTLTDAPGNSGDIVDLEWGLFAGSADYGGGSFLEGISGLSPSTYVFTTTPLGPDVYNISAFSAGSSGGPPKFSNYTFSFVVQSTVTATPEPGMFIVGLVALGLPVGSKKFRTFIAARL
jgi:hypothetical protein